MRNWLSQQFQQSPSLYKLWLAFNRRTHRERLLLLSAALCLAALVLVYGVWVPSQQEKLGAERRLMQAHSQYQLLLMNAEKLATPQNTGYQLRDRDATELLQIVSQTASQAGFTADRINYEGQGGLQIWASDVPFATVSAWLAALAKERVMITEFQLERLGVGRVSIRFTLS